MDAKELIGMFGYLSEGLEAIERRHEGLHFSVDLGSGVHENCLLVRMWQGSDGGTRTVGYSIPWSDLTDSKFPMSRVRTALAVIERELVGNHPGA